MSAERSNRLNVSLWRAFLLQMTLISASVVAGVFLAEFAIRELLIESALTREADYFWSRRNIDSATPAPNTNTLIGYVFKQDSAEIPGEFAGLSMGIHDIQTPAGEAVVQVSESGSERLYLVFDANNVKELATYFGVAPLALMLIALYSSAWVAYLIARRAVSPVIRLARTVRDVDLDAPGAADLLGRQLDGSNSEIEVLGHALQNLLTRVHSMVERERLFTREASHELRSPLTVIRMASDNLLRRHALEPAAQTAIERIQRSARDMEELTEILLLLARENEGALGTEQVSVDLVIEQEINACRLLYADKPLELELARANHLVVEAAPRILSIVLGNLLRNACSYTDHGRVAVSVAGTSIVIEDEGIGIEKAQLEQVFQAYATRQHARGHGIGLSLVKRITDRFDWQISIESELSRGTRVTLTIPAAEVIALDERLPEPRLRA